MGEWLRALVLGVIQGLTEFLPVSSSAHLRIFPALFGWKDPGASFTAVIQLGTEAAVLLYFARDIGRIISVWVRSLFNSELRSDPNARLGWWVIIGTIPIGILGVLFQDSIKTVARDLRLIAATLIILGLILLVADRVGRKVRELDTLKGGEAVALGLAQACALIPGVSRSGGTITAALFLGFNRAAAARYSFLLAIPAVVSSGLFTLPDILHGKVEAGQEAYGVGPTALATVVAFFVGLASIRWLLRYLRTGSFVPFVVYRVGLGALVLVLLATGTLTPR